MRVANSLMQWALDMCFAGLCITTQTDYNIIKQCPLREKIDVLHTFIMFVLQFSFIVLLMTASLQVFLPMQTALMISAVISASVVMLEIRMISSIWTPKGILSEGVRLKDIGLIAFRLVIAFIFATAYAIPAELYLFSNDIDRQAKNFNNQKNQGLYDFFQEKLSEKKQLKEELTQQLANERATTHALEEKRSTLVNDSLRPLELEEIELKRLLEVEKQGLEGRPEGEGSKYKEYFNKWTAKSEQIALANLSKEKIESAIADRQTSIDRLAGNLDALKLEIISFDSRKLAASHPDYEDDIPNGLSARFRLLQSLKNDPVDGSTFVFFSWIIKIVMITLELLPLIAKLVFSPASIYSERLASQTRCEVAKLRVDTALEIQSATEKMEKKPGFGELKVIYADSAAEN